MKSSPESPNIRFETVRAAPVVSLGFFVIGILSLIASTAVLGLHPSVAFEDSEQMEFLSFAALIGMGFVGSFVFGAAYLVAPVMGGATLYSERGAHLHLLLHGAGLGCLVIVLGGMNFMENPQAGLAFGLCLVLAGAAIHIANLLATASRFNRWEPEQLTLVSGLFWLGLSALAGGAVLVNNWFPFLETDSMKLLRYHAPLGVVGFLWLSLIGIALKAFNLFLVSEKSAGFLSWIGWALVNLALMALVPFYLIGNEVLPLYATGAIFVGSLFYIGDVVRLWLAARRPIDWALSGSFIGLLTGLVPFVWILAGMPGFGVEEGGITSNDAARIIFLVGVLGTFAVVLPGLAMRLLPFLVWQIRCAPLVARQSVLPPSALIGRSPAAGAIICLIAGWAYLVAAQWWSSPAGIQIAVVCWAVGLFWFVVSIHPAIRAFVYGVQVISSGDSTSGEKTPPKPHKTAAS